MNSHTEKTFEDIADDAREQAEAVPCPIDDFIEGLGIIIELLTEVRQAAEETKRG